MEGSVCGSTTPAEGYSSQAVNCCVVRVHLSANVQVGSPGPPLHAAHSPTRPRALSLAAMRPASPPLLCGRGLAPFCRPLTQKEAPLGNLTGVTFLPKDAAGPSTRRSWAGAVKLSVLAGHRGNCCCSFADAFFFLHAQSPHLRAIWVSVQGRLLL